MHVWSLSSLCSLPCRCAPREAPARSSDPTLGTSFQVKSADARVHYEPADHVANLEMTQPRIYEGARALAFILYALARYILSDANFIV